MTDEETRAEAYRRQSKLRAQAIRDRVRLLRGNAEARRHIQKITKPLLPERQGDTSYPAEQEDF